MSEAIFAGVLEASIWLWSMFPPPVDCLRVVPDVCSSLEPLAIGTNEVPNRPQSPQIFEPVSHPLSGAKWAVDDASLLRRLSHRQSQRMLHRVANMAI